MKMLMHQCCGPCSLHPLTYFKSTDFQVTAYFFNPNIHPVTEYYKRLETAIEVNNRLNIPYLFEEDYGLIEFLREHVGAENKRCLGCYKIRLEKTAQKAKELGFEYFTSTLLYSKMQNHEGIIETAKNAASKYGVQFFYYDFREGWMEGINISKDMGIYRQNYCGCIYSEMDRFLTQLSGKFNKKIARQTNGTGSNR